METISSIPACHAAGCTYRMLDYWSRLGTIVPSKPAKGCGSNRGWSLEDTALLRAVTQLRQRGAPVQVCKKFAALVRDNPEVWTGLVALDAEGDLNRHGLPFWTLDLADCRQHVLDLGLFRQVDEAVA